MKNNVVDNATGLALKSFSMWANYLGIAVLVFPEIRYYFWEIDTDPQLVWITGLSLIVFGAVGRLVDQGLSDGTTKSRTPTVVTKLMWGLLAVVILFFSYSVKAMPVSVEAFSKVAVPLVAKWEGKMNNSYQDIVGVWTICYGHTRTAKAGQHKTDEQCNHLLAEEILDYRHGLHNYFSKETKEKRLNVLIDASYSSLAFNVGIRAAGKSTATNRLNTGKLRGGCKALTWWNRAGGRVIRGLQNRRHEEYQMCLNGVKELENPPAKIC